ncbi:MAG: glyoxylate/hydroxypyruvate reductase A [Betaproteobacteria bacterium]|nr:glyoxylate/hydroxypyruvate reductase A [Betaproteobacteria bacterium]
MMKIAVVFADEKERLNWTQALQAAFAGSGIEAEVSPYNAQASANNPIKADYAVGWLPPAAFFAAQPQLKAFFNAGAGVDAILRSKTVPADLAIYRLEDAGMGLQMAQYCALECLHVLGQREAYAEDQRHGRWQQREPLDALDYPVGILGMGVLGQQVATSLQALGFPVQGFRRQDDSPANWQRFLQATRILILLAPLTEKTRGMINAEALDLLRPGAWLINVARGPLVVEADLLHALDHGLLAGASLDVFCQEPLDPSSRFWQHPKVRITPHVAACTLLQPAVKQIAAKMMQLIGGESPSGKIDRKLAY